MQRRLRYILECSACTAAVVWLTFELTGPTQAGFSPPVSSLHWSWSDLAVRSSPSLQAHQITQVETGESVQVIRRPDGWAAIIDTVAPRNVGFIPDSALHPQRLPTLASANAQVGAALEAIRADSMWATVEDPSSLRHVSNGRFEAAGMFTASQGEPRQYSLQLQYKNDNSWEAVLLTVQYLAN